jgi:virginiamycin B lyase
MRRLILGVALLAIIVGAAALGFAAGGHATSAPAAAPVHLYWANNTEGWGARPAATTIGRARLDGTGVEHSFVSGAGRRPCGVALDRKHIYWAELQGGKVGSPDKGGAIGRANRDGSAVNASFIPTPGPMRGLGDCGVAIAGGHIYWASVDNGTIGRANLDGSGVDGQFIPGLAITRSTSPISNGGGPCGIAVAGKYIYWINFVEGATPVAIGRANLNGTGVNKRFIPGHPANGCGIAVAGGYIYWTNDMFVKSRYAIGRANLDGTGVNHRFIRTAGIPCGVAAYQGHIYWGVWKGGYAHPSTTIGRANLDGTGIDDQFITGIQEFCLGELAVG